MAEYLIDNLEHDTKELIVSRLTQGVSQRKIAEELNNQGVSISDMSIGRWWKENKSKYSSDHMVAADSDTDKIIEQLINKLDKTQLKAKEEDRRLIIQQLLQELMLRYAIDINEKTKSKQQGGENHYPTDLISSLKILTELYLKIKEDNRLLKNNNEFIF